jgi:5-methylcytosine-specific restriction endonuclease McrA
MMRLFWRFQLWRHNLTEADARWIASKEWLVNNWQWDQIRYDALAANDGRCELCGRSKHELERGNHLNVDHVKPRKTHPWLALNLSNLQILCGSPCNRGKGNRSTRDWRRKDHPHRKLTGL